MHFGLCTFSYLVQKYEYVIHSLRIVKHWAGDLYFRLQPINLSACLIDKRLTSVLSVNIVIVGECLHVSLSISLLIDIVFMVSSQDLHKSTYLIFNQLFI